jgi:hypothetical protein
MIWSLVGAMSRSALPTRTVAISSGVPKPMI